MLTLVIYQINQLSIGINISNHLTSWYQYWLLLSTTILRRFWYKDNIIDDITGCKKDAKIVFLFTFLSSSNLFGKGPGAIK